MPKELLFSVTRDQFDWDFFRAGGKGGQNVNKRDTACRCTHRPSGAIGVSRDERSQGQNRKLAFRRCVESKPFQAWIKIRASMTEAERREMLTKVNELADKALAPENLKIEYFEPKK